MYKNTLNERDVPGGSRIYSTGFSSLSVIQACRRRTTVASSARWRDLSSVLSRSLATRPERRIDLDFDGLVLPALRRCSFIVVLDEQHVSVYLRVNKPIKATFTVLTNGSSISKTDTREFTDHQKCSGFPQYASHESLRPLFRSGKLTIRCNVEYEYIKPVDVPRVFQLFEHVPTDVEFVIGSERVQAHKYFLSLISPVFQEMFAHNTAESKSGRIAITEFNFNTVKTAIDFCYGREWKNLSVETAVGMLRFCDKYFITPVINKLEKLQLLHPSVSTFCTVVQYAYDCNKDALLAECYKFFKEHQDEIKSTPKFAKLRPRIAVFVLKFAFDLETDIDILRHAHRNGIEFVMTYIEAVYFESIMLDNFCVVVHYAWECSRKELQQACAKFLNEHRDEVLNLKEFHNLSSDVVGKVLKSSYVLQHGGD